MFLLEWYKQWLDIRSHHRSDNILVERDEKVCQSCETLKQQLEIANYEKQQLLNRLLEKPAPTVERTEAPVPVTRPTMLPWRVRQQMLEKEDRAKAKALREAAKPDNASSVDADAQLLEKELKDAESQREAAAVDRRTQ